MHIRRPKLGMGRAALILIGIVSALSISAKYALVSQTLYLPLIFNRDPSTTVSPTPPPPATIQLRVTPSNPDKDWALAYFAKSYNLAGKPVMQIYPGDSAPDSERIKIPRGTIVLALENPVTADGGGKYWQLVDYKGRNKEVLFLRALDATKVP